MTEQDREFYLFCIDMRLRGVHQDWMYVWRGAYEEYADWMASPIAGRWPVPDHFKPMKQAHDYHPAYDRQYERGKIWWDSLEEKP